jgi:uncharacterized protein (DUF2147 family)
MNESRTLMTTARRGKTYRGLEAYDPGAGLSFQLKRRFDFESMAIREFVGEVEFRRKGCGRSTRDEAGSRR